MKKYLYTLLVLVVVLVGAIAVKAQSGSAVLHGWAWSSNIGWISMNSDDANTGSIFGTKSVPLYGVSVGPNGDLSGYGWSSNIGWISFNSTDLTGCPGTGVAHVSTSTGAVSGRARAVRGKDISIIGNNNGAWDGCINLAQPIGGPLYPTVPFLSGSATSSGGVSYNNASKLFSGYAWGSDVVGWLRFNPSLAGGPSDVGCVGPGCGGGTETLFASCNISGSTLLVSDIASITYTATSTGTAGRGPNSDYVYKWGNPLAVDSNIKTVSYSSTGTKSIDMSIKRISDGLESTNSCSVTITDGSTPPAGSGECITPRNTVQCTTGLSSTSTSTDPSRIFNNCPTSFTNVCTYICATNYTLRAGQCVIATEVEI